MKKLISMTDFVLEQNNYRQQRFSQIVDYAIFLKQPLELWMFVPYDENGNVLEEKSIFNTTDEDYIFNSEDFDKYQQAKERCLFDGFEAKEFKGTGNFSVVDNSGLLNIMWKFKSEKNWRPSIGISTTEDLVRYNLELTETAQKKIFG